MTTQITEEKTEKHKALRKTLLDEIQQGQFRVGDLFYSQNEIAARFEVSQTTVQRALKALRDEGYIRRRRGRGTFVTRPRGKANKLHSLLLIVEPRDLIIQATASMAVNHLLELAGKDGVHVRYHQIPPDYGAKPPLPKALGSDAVVVMGSARGTPWLVRERTDAPIVVIRPDGWGAVSWFDCVNRDYLGGPHVVLSHLRDCGYDRIGVLGGSPRSLTHHLRMEGTLAAANALDLTIKPEWIINTDFRGEEAYGASLALLRGEDRPRAIFAFGDGLAAGALRAAHELGLSVPEDIAVAGFDGLDQSGNLTPPLTCYHTDPKEMGRRAYELLDFRLRNPDALPQCEIVEGSLVLRQSTRNEPALSTVSAERSDG